MDPIVNIQKSADTPISGQAMTDISRVKTADEIALDFPWDITSPEGIIAFFGAKMESTNAELKKAMYSQNARNAANQAMKGMKDLLSKYDGDSKIEPGTPDYDEFKRLAAEVEGSLGASADENSLKASIDSVLAPGHYDKNFDTVNDAKALADFAAAHPDATATPNGETNDLHPILNMAIENGPKSITASTAKDLGNKLTTITDGYQNANQLAIINVQDLVNQISQITSLASNIVHSFNDAAMGPIGNIK